MNRHLIVSLLLSLLIPCMVSVAQTAPEVPNVVVLVKPMGNQALLAVTYSGVVKHDLVKKAITRIAAGLNVSVLSSSVSDVELPGVAQRETGGEALLSGTGELISDKPHLQPILDALADQKLFEVFLMVPRRETYAGLRSFSSPSVNVELLGDTGATRYRFHVLRPGTAMPKLPREQAAVVAPQPAHLETKQSNHVMGWMLIVVAIAGLLALAIYWSLRIKRARNALAITRSTKAVVVHPRSTASGRKDY